MEVHGQQVKDIKIELSDFEIRRIVLTKLEEIFKLKVDYEFKDGNIVEDVEYHTSHSFYNTEVIREATGDDEDALKFIKKVAAEL